LLLAFIYVTIGEVLGGNMKINEIAPLFGIENKDGMFIGKIHDFDVQLELVPVGYVKFVYLNVLLNRSITKNELAESTSKQTSWPN
jgi:hypothetical protein